MTILPTGTQFDIRHDDFTAVVTEVGATLRSVTHQGRELLWTFAADEQPRGFAGATLAPWPNRIRDGAYTFDGVAHTLPLNEPGFHNAIHGLVFDTPWSLRARTDDSLTLSSVVYPQIGWPGTLQLELSYALHSRGLDVSFRATNAGAVAVPFGYGAHPVFAFPDVGRAVLSLPFGRRLHVDDRLLPTRVDDVEGAMDFREPREIGDVSFDTAFTAASGAWEVHVEGPDHRVSVWADESFGWVQLYTRPERGGLAIEPMTCGPDAFNAEPAQSGVLRLEPGDHATGTWGIRVS
jgi:aldose 1-epimerase